MKRFASEQITGLTMLNVREAKAKKALMRIMNDRSGLGTIEFTLIKVTDEASLSRAKKYLLNLEK